MGVKFVNDTSTFPSTIIDGKIYVKAYDNTILCVIMLPESLKDIRASKIDDRDFRFYNVFCHQELDDGRLLIIRRDGSFTLYSKSRFMCGYGTVDLSQIRQQVIIHEFGSARYVNDNMEISWAEKEAVFLSWLLEFVNVERFYHVSQFCLNRHLLTYKDIGALKQLAKIAKASGMREAPNIVFHRQKCVYNRTETDIEYHSEIESFTCREDIADLDEMPEYLTLSRYLPRMALNKCSRLNDKLDRWFEVNMNLEYYYGQLVHSERERRPYRWLRYQLFALMNNNPNLAIGTILHSKCLTVIDFAGNVFNVEARNQYLDEIGLSPSKLGSIPSTFEDIFPDVKIVGYEFPKTYEYSIKGKIPYIYYFKGYIFTSAGQFKPDASYTPPQEFKVSYEQLKPVFNDVENILGFYVTSDGQQIFIRR